MHVAFLTSEYPPLPSGGIGTSIRNLGRAMVAQGHRVTVLGWGPQAEFNDQGVQVRFLGHTNIPKAGWFANRLLAQRELNRLVRDEGVQIVEAPDWCGLSAGLRLRCPLVIRCHGSATYFAHLLKDTVRSTVRLAERYALIGASDVMAVSRFTADVTRELFGLNRPIGVIPNGVDLAQFSPADARETEPNTILYFGTLVRKKGVLDLGPVFSRVLELNGQARLVLVGRDSADKATGSPSTWALLQESLSSQARKRVQYLGGQPYEKVQEFVRRAAVCVFPSYAEAFPLSWLEAMACAKPVIAYDIGWASEAIHSGISGLLVPAGDVEAFSGAICGLLSDLARGRALGLAARQRVEAVFSAGVVAQRSTEWYDRVLSA